MKLAEIEAIDKEMLTCADVAPYLGFDPNSLRLQAREDPTLLGFPVVVAGTRVQIPKVNSRMAQVHGAAVREGRDERFTIISKLADPDAYGAERVQATGVSFDDLIIADWESGNIIKHDAPLTFTDYDYLDMIGA